MKIKKKVKMVLAEPYEDSIYLKIIKRGLLSLVKFIFKRRLKFLKLGIFLFYLV